MDNMTPQIKAAVQRGKTCAPARCLDEGTCFLLAKEVERLHELLEIEKNKSNLIPITSPLPNYETSNPLWNTYGDASEFT